MKWLLLVALIAVCLKRGFTHCQDKFECYSCLGSKDIDKGCTDPFNPGPPGVGVTKEPCASKLCGKASGVVPGNGTVVGRFCNGGLINECTKDDVGTCREKDITFFGMTVRTNLCCCSSDLCNGANPTSAFIASTLALVLLAIVI